MGLQNFKEERTGAREFGVSGYKSATRALKRSSCNQEEHVKSTARSASTTRATKKNLGKEQLKSTEKRIQAVIWIGGLRRGWTGSGLSPAKETCFEPKHRGFRGFRRACGVMSGRSVQDQRVGSVAAWPDAVGSLRRRNAARDQSVLKGYTSTCLAFPSSAGRPCPNNTERAPGVIGIDFGE